MEEVRKLYELQSVEIEVDKLRSKLEKLNSFLDEKRVFLQELASESENKKKELERLLMGLHNKEIDLKEIEEHIAALKKMLYSGRGSSRELVGVEKKIRNLSKKKDEKETEVLELMEDLSQAEEVYKRFLNNMEEKKRSAIKEMEEKIIKKKEIEAQICHLCEDVERMESNIDVKYLSLYNELKGKVKNPVALVIDGVCSGCLITLPTNVLKMLKEDSGPVRCDSCGRILLMEK